MDINETMAREIAQQLGIGGGGARADQDMIRRLEGKSDTELMQELARLQTEKFLTARQAEAVDAEKILALFSSELGKRILNAKNLRREFKFSILTDAGAYDPAAAGEQVMLQGVVDCFWQEADGIVILDFKTDYIDGDLQLKAARYAPQLQAYARALSLIYGLSVRKCILYFFSAGKAVEIDPE